jgi:hypothetical protein
MSGFFGCVKYAVISIGILITLGVIGGGIYMASISTSYQVCSDWSYTSNYGGMKCDFIFRNAGVALYCEQQLRDTNSTALCFCQNYITQQPTCITTLPPSHTSPSLMGGGVAMLVVGVVMLVLLIVFMAKFK